MNILFLEYGKYITRVLEHCKHYFYISKYGDSAKIRIIEPIGLGICATWHTLCYWEIEDNGIAPCIHDCRA